MKILLTGICGFAGSVITRTLLEHRSGLQILGLDNLSRKGSETNLEPLRALGCDIRIGDVRDRTLLESLPACDWIIDCAANPSVLAGVDGSSSRDLVHHAESSRRDMEFSWPPARLMMRGFSVPRKS
ncbi:MAG: NAD-dependent epimerase/dehydratase family protein, partial [Spartobacteria bacterium]